MLRNAAKIGIAGATVIAAPLILTMAALSQPKTPAATEARPDQFFELRIYTAAPGKMELLHKRFRDHTLRLFEKHGIKSIGYWTEADEENHERLYYLVAYPDRASREKMLVNGIAADPEFLKAVAESEKEGKLTTKIESVLLAPTSYSPLK